MVLTAICLLALAANPEIAPGPEEKDPGALLARAGIYEVDLNQCASAMRTYRAFFEVCSTCDLASYGRQRFQLALARCSEPPKKGVVTYEPGEDRNPADSTQAEVLLLVKPVALVDEKAALEMMIEARELGADAAPGSYNALRERAFEVLGRRDPTREEVSALLARVRKINPAFANALEGMIAFGSPQEQKTLQAARTLAIARIRESSSSTLPCPSDPKCKIDPAVDVGFVTVNSHPWGKVYFNGNYVGDTPISRAKAPCGSIEIRVVHPNSGAEKTGKLEVHPNKVHIVHFDLVDY